MPNRPRCVILAGPNGAGKSTHARAIISGLHGIDRYINPDTIAAGFGDARPDAVAFDAGRMALRAIDVCIDHRSDFAFETTLSGRRWSRLLDRLRDVGYQCAIYYLWIPEAGMCVERVRRRVASGGHAVNEADIRRRHASSLVNLLTTFLPRVFAWHLHDASADSGLILIASGGLGGREQIADPARWRQVTELVTPRRVRETAPYAYLDGRTTEDALDDSAHGYPTGVGKRSDDDEWVMPAPELIVAASRVAVRRALAIQRALGVSAVSMRDGKMVIIQPEELPRDVNDVEWTERQIARRQAEPIINSITSPRNASATAV